MPINYPDNVKHNNSAFPLILAADNTVQGWFHTANTTERDNIASTKRSLGAVCVVGTDLYVYQGADLLDATWQNASNWTGAGGGINLTDISVGPDATASGGGSISYNNLTGVFTFTPADMASKADASHTHAISDVTNLQTELDGKAASSHNHTLSDITDSGTAAALNVAATGDAAVGEVVKGDDTRLTDARTPTTHSHSISDVTGLQTALDGKAASSHTHAISEVTGLQTALDGKADDGTWTQASGTISGTIDATNGTFSLTAPTGGGGDALTTSPLDQFDTVTFTTLSDVDIMVYDLATTDWINVPPAGYKAVLFGASGTAGEYVGWDGTGWTAQTIAYSELTGAPALATVATTGIYNDLIQKPSFTAGANVTITPGVNAGGGTDYVIAAGGGTTINALDDIGDVDTTGVGHGSLLMNDLSVTGDWIDIVNTVKNDGDVLTWSSGANGGSGWWQSQANEPASLNSIGDVTYVGNTPPGAVVGTTGSMLFWTGTAWEYMYQTGARTPGDILTWDSANGGQPLWAAPGAASSVADNNVTSGTGFQINLLPDADRTRSIGTDTLRWADIHGDLDGAVTFRGTNASGSAMAIGDVVAIDTASLGEKPDLVFAQSGTSNFPAFGLVKTAANAGAEVHVVTSGPLYNVPLPTATYSVGDTLYVSTTSGNFTNVAPTSEANGLQNIGKVVRAHDTAGVIMVGGAGRSNATPNLNNNNIFLGNGSNQAVSTPLSSISITNFSGISPYGASLIDDTDAAAARTTLELGSAALNDTGDFATAGHTHTTSDITNIVNPTGLTVGQVLKVNAAGTGYDLLTLSTVATSGDYNDLANTPNLGSAAFLNVPLAGNDAGTTQVVRGDDTRMSDDRAPLDHDASKVTSGVFAAARIPSIDYATGITFPATLPNLNDNTQYVLAVTDATGGTDTWSWVDTSSFGAGVVDLSWNASTRTVVCSAGNDAVITLADGTNAGLMSSADFTKLSGIAAGAEVNVGTDLTNTPTSTVITLGSSTGTNTIVQGATTTLAGVMTATDKTKLDGIAAGAEVNVGTDLGKSTTTTQVTVTSSTGNDVALDAASGTAAGIMTSAQFNTLSSALQPGANISGLTNDSGYITGVSSINDIGNVTITSPANGQYLVVDAGGNWSNSSSIPLTTTSSISDLSDVSVANATVGGILYSNGTSVSNLVLGATPSAGDVLKWSGSSVPEWVTEAAQTDSISVVIESVAAAKDYKVILKMPHAGTVTEISTITGAGTCGVDIEFGGVAVNGSAISTSTSQTNDTTFAGTAAFSAGAMCELIVTSPSSCTDLVVTVTYTVG